MTMMEYPKIVSNVILHALHGKILINLKINFYLYKNIYLLIFFIIVWMIILVLIVLRVRIEFGIVLLKGAFVRKGLKKM